MTRRWHSTFAVVLSCSLAATAIADDKQICVDAYKKAQDLKDGTSLLAARESLRACGNASCTAFIVKDCTAWLVDVEARIPTIVFSAKSASGESMSDVRVFSGGTEVATSIDGKARETDPGSFQYEFVASDGRKEVVSCVVLEGQKGQLVTATFPAAGEAGKPETPTPTDDVKSDPSTNGSSTWSSTKTTALVVGGVGILGLGIGTILGLSAKSKYDDSSPFCREGNKCSSEGVSIRDDARSRAGLATVVFGLGAAALVTGVVLFATAPSGSGERMSVAVVPGGVVVGGAF